jgi:hypothetical protein
LDLAQAFEDDLAREIIVGVFVESENHVRQTVQRDRAHDDHFRHAIHFDFDRERDKPLDFFRGVAGPLRNDFHHGR